MRSLIVKRDHQELIPRVLEKIFPDAAVRRTIEAMLDEYTGLEAFRVQLGILKGSRGDIEEIRRLSRLARSDFRDLLVEVEYPLSFNKDRLRESDPERYDRLIEKEQREYDQWLTEILAT